MMKNKLFFDEKFILNRKFTANVAGYDALEVDTLLDKVIQDYVVISKFYKEHQKIVQENEKLRKKVLDLEAKNSLLEKTITDSSVNTKTTGSNLELLQIINKYERYLWDKGIDPNKIKKSV